MPRFDVRLFEEMEITPKIVNIVVQPDLEPNLSAR